MTISELQIQLDIKIGNETEVLDQHANKTSYGYIFVDSSDGQCYLFDKHGKLDDIRKVKNIESWAFEYCISLKSIIIPGSVESIGNDAFDCCTSLESITIPDSVESIGSEAFWNCASLKSIMISSSANYIGNRAFYRCASLEEVIFEGKTIEQVKAMNHYPWGIEDASIIKCR